MAYNRLEISGVTIYGNVFQPKSYGVKRRIDCMLSEPSTFEVQDYLRAEMCPVHTKRSRIQKTLWALLW